jgi:hypothetical protein
MMRMKRTAMRKGMRTVGGLEKHELMLARSGMMIDLRERVRPCIAALGVAASGLKTWC